MYVFTHWSEYCGVLPISFLMSAGVHPPASRDYCSHKSENTIVSPQLFPSLESVLTFWSCLKFMTSPK